MAGTPAVGGTGNGVAGSVLYSDSTFASDDRSIVVDVYATSSSAVSAGGQGYAEMCSYAAPLYSVGNGQYTSVTYWIGQQSLMYVVLGTQMSYKALGGSWNAEAFWQVIVTGPMGAATNYNSSNSGTSFTVSVAAGSQVTISWMTAADSWACWSAGQKVAGETSSAGVMGMVTVTPGGTPPTNTPVMPVVSN